MQLMVNTLNKAQQQQSAVEEAEMAVQKRRSSAGTGSDTPEIMVEGKVRDKSF